MNNRDNTSLPDELSALERSLSELSPVSKLDEGRLFYEAGYAAALAECPTTRPGTRTTLTAAGSALVGVAATLLVVFIQTTTAPPRQAQVIQHRPPPEDPTGHAAPSAGSTEAGRVEGGSIAASPAPSPAYSQQRDTSRIVPQQREAEGDHADLAYSTLRLRDQLLSGDDRSAEPKSPPVSFPDSSSIDGSSPEPLNILELQNEFFRELYPHPRVNS